MSLKLGNQDIASVKLGTQDITAVYKGSDEVWSAGGGEIGNWSCYHNASGYVSSNIIDPNGRDICIEFWFRPQDVSQGGYASLCGQWEGNGAWMLCYIDGGRGPVSWMWFNTSDTYGTAVSPSNLDHNTWYHVVIQAVWSEQAVGIWWDGQWKGSFPINQPLGWGASQFWQNASGIRKGAYTTGHSFRISEIKRYTSGVSFTPPTEAYTADEHTFWLTDVGPEPIEYSGAGKPCTVQSAIPIEETPWS